MSNRETTGAEKRTLRQVDIAQMCISDDPGDILVTYSLGSCIGLALYDPVLKLGGLIHCMLPLSGVDTAKAGERPAMFVDSGVSRMLQDMFDRGALRKRLIARVAGGATILDERGFFKIGERNHTILRKILWKNSILIAGEDTGGSAARSMYLHIDTGTTEIRSDGERYIL